MLWHYAEMQSEHREVLLHVVAALLLFWCATKKGTNSTHRHQKRRNHPPYRL